MSIFNREHQKRLRPVMDYMILDLDTGDKFYVNDKSSASTSLTDVVKMVKSRIYPCALYRPNPKPRCVYDDNGDVCETSKRWIYNDVSNITDESIIPKYVD